MTDLKKYRKLIASKANYTIFAAVFSKKIIINLSI